MTTSLHDRDFHRFALIEAGRETGPDESGFPADCPWPFERLMDAGFWPQ